MTIIGSKKYDVDRTTPSEFQALEIANRCIHGEITTEEAVGSLKQNGVFGHYLAGEMALERAFGQPEHMSMWIKSARHSFTGAIKHANDEGDVCNLGTSGRASLRIAQLDAYKTIYSKQKLPDAIVAKQIHRRVSNIGQKLVSASGEHHDKARTKGLTVLRGVISEVAVLLLAQRFAIREIGTEEWLPIQALFSEDHGGNCMGQAEKPPFDIAILTQYGDEPIAQGYKIQVKTAVNKVEQNQGVECVRIRDLALGPKDQRIAEKIIVGRNMEIEQPERAGRVSVELDRYTDKFLEIIG